MSEDELQRFLSSKTKESRTRLYFNKERVHVRYTQLYHGIDKIEKIKKRGWKVHAGTNIFGIGDAGGGYERAGDTSFHINIDDILQALAIEFYAEKNKLLTDVSDMQTIPAHTNILKYQGDAFLTFPWDSLPDMATGLSADVAKKIQDKRVEEEKVLKGKDNDDPKTAVWTATTNSEKTLAFIADWKNVVRSNIRGYGGQTRIGLLGQPKKVIDDIIFLWAFWIWAPPTPTG